MPAEFHNPSEALMRVTVSGVLQHAELARLQAEAERLIARVGRIRVLVELRDFAGWESSDSWTDVGFEARRDRDIGRIAVVGDARWKDEALAFLGAGFRSAPVRYFEASELDAALTWLG
jgi:hypothetical protein